MTHDFTAPLALAAILSLVSAQQPAKAQDCSQWLPEERPLCEKQKRSTAVVENFTRHSPLDQEGSFQRIEAMKAAEQARAIASAAPPTVIGGSGGYAGGGDHVGRNALAERAAIDRAQSATGSRFSSRRESDGAAKEALLRQSEALGVAPVLPNETRINVIVPR